MNGERIMEDEYRRENKWKFCHWKLCKWKKNPLDGLKSRLGSGEEKINKLKKQLSKLKHSMEKKERESLKDLRDNQAVKVYLTGVP